MKPKNRVYCRECHRQKLVFESQAKAERFIQFNADEIEKETGYRPVRAYFCMMCDGWHTTSSSRVPNKRIVHDIVEAYRHEPTYKKACRKLNVNFCE